MVWTPGGCIPGLGIRIPVLGFEVFKMLIVNGGYAFNVKKETKKKFKPQEF